MTVEHINYFLSNISDIVLYEIMTKQFLDIRDHYNISTCIFLVTFSAVGQFIQSMFKRQILNKSLKTCILWMRKTDFCIFIIEKIEGIYKSMEAIFYY